MPEALCFDVYGSTHDQGSVADALGDATGLPDDVAGEMARRWADSQLRYSMEVTLMDRYETWWELAARALDDVLAYYGVDLDDDERDAVLDTYNHLDPHEGWEPLRRLREAGHELYILSDGNPEMLETLAGNTGMDEHLDGIISVHEARAFKPAPEAYRTVLDHVDRELDECRMVATHLFDLAGAANVGMRTAFVNRHGVPDRYMGFSPDLTVPTYERLADELA
ncbi:MAG: haloacid dehalogenase type II [Haloferacaceae archaeon]